MRRLKSFSRTSLRFSSVSGQRVLSSYQQLRSLVLKRLKRRDIADLFSIPEEDPEKQEFVWYTDLPGKIVPFDALDPKSRSRCEAELTERLSALKELARAIRLEAVADRRSLEAEIIDAAASVPDDSCKFVVGEQVVLAAWGSSLVSTERAPVDVVWTGQVAEVAPAAESPVESAEAPTLATASTAPVAPTLPPPPRERRRFFLGLPRFLLWLAGILLVLLLAILLALLLSRGGGWDFKWGWSLPWFSSEERAVETVNAAKEKELRIEIDALKKQLEAKLQSCPVPDQSKQGALPQAPTPSPTPAEAPTLAIPSDAIARKDASFLAGCWNAPDVPVTFAIGTRQETSANAEAILCFKPDGKTGQRTIRTPTVTCEGPLSTEFQNDNVRIQAPRMTCSNKSTFSEATIVCRPKGSQTICEATQPGGAGPIEMTFTKRDRP